MFSYFYPQVPEPVKTRLELTPQLKDILPQLQELRDKAAELKVDADDNPGAIGGNRE